MKILLLLSFAGMRNNRPSTPFMLVKQVLTRKTISPAEGTLCILYCYTCCISRPQQSLRCVCMDESICMGMTKSLNVDYKPDTFTFTIGTLPRTSVLDMLAVCIQRAVWYMLFRNVTLEDSCTSLEWTGFWLEHMGVNHRGLWMISLSVQKVLLFFDLYYYYRTQSIRQPRKW